MAERGQNLLHQIRRAEAETAGVQTGMTAEVLILQQIPVNQQADAPVPIIYQTEDADRSRFQAQVFFQMSGIGKAQTGAPDLFGKQLRLEGFLPRHDQQIEIRLLSVAEEQVFADFTAEKAFNLLAVLNGVRVFVVNPEKRNIQFLQQIITTFFPRAARLSGTSGIQMMIVIHKMLLSL